MLLRIRGVLHESRRFIQALYLSGSHTKGTPRILEPILDFEHRLSDRTGLEQNLNRRKISSLNIDDIFAQWEMFNTIESKKGILRMRQKEVKELLKEVKETKPCKDKENILRKYTIESETIKEDLQNLIDHSTTIEDKFINSFLSLPNNLSNRVPDDAQIVSTHGNKPADAKQTHHLNHDHAIIFHNEYTYYLKGEAAFFDGNFPMNCIDYFLKNGFIHLSNPDFVRTLMVEGAGYTVEDVFGVSHHMDSHHTNVPHLVGNGSMLSFLGFITRMRVPGTLLPLQWISSGKTYTPTVTNDDGLFNVSQSTTVQVFMAGSKEQMQQKFDETMDLMKNLFNLLGIHYRVVCIPANELHAAEYYSKRIEMYSPHLDKYIEVGRLSNYSDYISKRLIFLYAKDQKKNICKFNHIVSGTICNVTKLIGILLEMNEGIVSKDLLEKIK